MHNISSSLEVPDPEITIAFAEQQRESVTIPQVTNVKLSFIKLVCKIQISSSQLITVTNGLYPISFLPSFTQPLVLRLPF